MNATAENLMVDLPRGELLKLCAADTNFYCHQFFPKAFRQRSPEFHRDFWNKFEDPDYDYFAAEMFRGSAKTTLTRAGISKRVAFGISRNILSVAINETMAANTVIWLRKQMETNTYWTDTFMLQKGKKWSDDWIEIYSVAMGFSINVVAKGMTSGLRGLNLDDWRPDFIMCDDICNEENTGTEEQRNKTKELFFGALSPSLAPRSEAPLRKFVLLQTGLHKEDVINLAHKDPTFKTVKYPKIVEKESGEVSAWPERFSTEECLQEKEDYIRRSQIHIWLREFGCKIVSRETAPLKEEWLRPYTVLPTNLKYYIGIDPASSKKKSAHRSALGVVGVSPTGDVYICDAYGQKGKNPDEIWEWLVSRWRSFRPRKTGVETIAYQETLAWYFEKKMQESSFFFAIDRIQDRRSKADRLIQAFSGLGSQGKLWINPNLYDFIAGFSSWTEELDWDLGDAVAQAIALANPWMAKSSLEGEFEVIEDDEKEYAELVFEGGAP